MNESIEFQYRELYWQKNEVDIILGDVLDLESRELLQKESRDMEAKMQEIVNHLGYVPGV